MTPDESFEKWLLDYYIKHGHYFSKNELRECWTAATRTTALRCVEISDEQVSNDVKRGRLQSPSVVARCIQTIKQEFGL